MAFTHGKDTAFLVDNAAGTLTDLSGFTDNVEGLPGEMELADTTAYGDGGHKTVVGLENSRITASGHGDFSASAIDEVLAGIRGLTATQTFEYGPAGSGSGAVKYTGECRLQTYTITSPVAGKVSWSATFMVDGAATRGTFA